MSVNKNQPHIYVLPEDKADRELATGFHMEVDQKHDLLKHNASELGRLREHVRPILFQPIS